MRVAVLDCETWLKARGGGAPPFVCFGWATFEDGAVLESGLVTHLGEYTNLPEGMPQIPHVDPSEVVRWLCGWVLESHRQDIPARFVNQNIPFDLSVLAATDPALLDLFFELYDERLIEDTMLREQLLDIAAGSLGYHRDRKSAAGKKIKKRYSLASLAREWLGVEMDKTTWRKGYKDLHGVPLSDWPQGAIDYGIDDAIDTGLVYFAQRQDVLEDIEDGEIPNSTAQARAHWALYLASIWGIRTDPKRVHEFKAELMKSKGWLKAALEKTGFVRGSNHQGKKGKLGSKDMAAIKGAMFALAERIGFDLLLTDAAEKADVDQGTYKETDNPLTYVSTSKEAINDLIEAAGMGLGGDIEEGSMAEIREVENRTPLEMGIELAKIIADDGTTIVSGDDGAAVAGPPLSQAKHVIKDEQALGLVPLFTSVDKLLGTYVPVLEEGTRHPINPEYRPIVETGRASCAKPNLMNLPKAPGVRECYVARPGYVFCTVDYEALELHTLAQACLWLVGHSRLADALNEGLDPHLAFACEYLLQGVGYDEGKIIRKDEGHPRHTEIVHARNIAKAGNFGLPGGLGARKFVKFCKNSGIEITIDEAYELKANWFRQWPEMREYFKFIKNSIVEDDEGEQYVNVEQCYTARIRGKARYTAACNSYFQGLAADGAKESCYRISHGCYVEGSRYNQPTSLYGSRLLVFVHDENIMEHPEESAHERAYQQAKIMIDTMQEYCPDVRIKAEPALMYRWYKDATERFDENGRLIAYEPHASA